MCELIYFWTVCFRKEEINLTIKLKFTIQSEMRSCWGRGAKLFKTNVYLEKWALSMLLPVPLECCSNRFTRADQTYRLLEAYCVAVARRLPLRNVTINTCFSINLTIKWLTSFHANKVFRNVEAHSMWETRRARHCIQPCVFIYIFIFDTVCEIEFDTVGNLTSHETRTFSTPSDLWCSWYFCFLSWNRDRTQCPSGPCLSQRPCPSTAPSSSPRLLAPLSSSALDRPHLATDMDLSLEESTHRHTHTHRPI